MFFSKILCNFAVELPNKRYMEPKIGDRMKVSPQLTDQADWIDGEVIDVEHNPFTGLVISIKDKLGRIFFGQSRFFVAIWPFHMFAIAFDMDIKELRNSYGEPYNNAYYEIKIILRKYNFFNTQGSVYLTDKDDMANLFAAIYALKKITWFKNAVRDIRAFKVENWSDFTQIVKEDD